MSLERELHEHFNRAGGALPAPPDRLGDVVRRGRRRRVAQGGVLAAVVVAAALSLPTVIDGLTPTRVDLAPADPVPGLPSESSETSQTEPTPTEAATEAATEAPESPPTVAIDELGAPVMWYQGSDLVVARGKNQSFALWSGRRIDAVIPDGDGGAVVQTRNDLLWVRADSMEIPLASTRRPLVLRAVLPDGRVVYSTRPTDEQYSEDAIEEYFIGELSTNFTASKVATAGAHESGTVGPALTPGGGFVFAGCHLMCTMYEGIAEPEAGARPVHDPQRAIGGLTSIDGGRVVAFVEIDLRPEPDAPVLVLMDGDTFEILRRIELDVPRPEYARVVVSLADGGQRILVGFGSATSVHVQPEMTYLVERAMAGKPTISRVEGRRAVLWLDSPASGLE